MNVDGHMRLNQDLLIGPICARLIKVAKGSRKNHRPIFFCFFFSLLSLGTSNLRLTWFQLAHGMLTQRITRKMLKLGEIFILWCRSLRLTYPRPAGMTIYNNGHAIEVDWSITSSTTVSGIFIFTMAHMKLIHQCRNCWFLKQNIWIRTATFTPR